MICAQNFLNDDGDFHIPKIKNRMATWEELCWFRRTKNIFISEGIKDLANQNLLDTEDVRLLGFIGTWGGYTTSGCPLYPREAFMLLSDWYETKEDLIDHMKELVNDRLVRSSLLYGPDGTRPILHLRKELGFTPLPENL